MGPPRVITLLKSFSNASLVSLMNHEYVAVHVKEFFDPALSHQLALTIEQQYENNECKNWKVTTSQGGLESSDVLTVNTPYNVAQQSQSPKDVEKYFANVKATNDSFRSSGQIHPLDKLRLELDEAWPAGANLGREKTPPYRPLAAGQVRVMAGPTRWKNGFVHVDDMSPLSKLGGTFSANVYLRLPGHKDEVEYEDGDEDETGHHLNIWDVDIDSHVNKDKLLNCLTSQDAASQIFLKRELGVPIKVTVEPGDLVLLCAQRPHSVAGFEEEGALRISYQTFISYSGLGQNLVIDS